MLWFLTSSSLRSRAKFLSGEEEGVRVTLHDAFLGSISHLFDLVFHKRSPLVLERV